MSLPGLDKVLEEISDKALYEATRKSLAKFGAKVERDAKRLCPVDTGNLKSSIQTKYDRINELEVDVTAGANYAAYVEFGTGPFAARQVAQYDQEWQDLAAQYETGNPGNMRARPYLYPAVNQNLNFFEETLIKELTKK